MNGKTDRSKLPVTRRTSFRHSRREVAKMDKTSTNGDGYNTFERKENTCHVKAITIDEALDHVGFGWRQVMYVTMTSILMMADGMEIMVMAILGPTLEYEWHITPLQQAFLTTFVFFGIAIGSLVFGYMSDKYGRRKNLILCSMWTLFYSVLTAAAPNYIWMLILRMLLGIGIGGGFQAATYVTEFQPVKYRGKISVIPLACWAVGGILNIIVALALVQFGWRWWLLVSSVPALLFILASPLLPKSPRYALACGRKDEALQILQKLAAGNGRTLPQVELKEIQVVKKGNIADLFVPKLKRTSIIAGCAWFNFGFMYYGLVLVTTYLIQRGTTCNSDIDISPHSATHCHADRHPLSTETYVGLLWTACAELPAVLLTLIIIDTVGRKFGSLYQTLGIVFTCILLNICLSRIPMLILLFAIRCCGLSAFQIIVIYTNEVYPTEVRALASGLGNCLARLGAMVTPYFAQVLLERSIHLGLATYTVIAIVTVILLAFLPFDTKGREMEENWSS